MYVDDGPLYWALSNSPHMWALLMLGVIVFFIVTLKRHWSLRGLAYAVLGIVFALVLALGGYALVGF